MISHLQILLDFGLAEELTPRVRKHFISFLHCIAAGDGARGAYHMLQFGEKQACADPGAFEVDMCAMFARECNIYALRGVDVDRVCPCPSHFVSAGLNDACPLYSLVSGLSCGSISFYALLASPECSQEACAALRMMQACAQGEKLRCTQTCCALLTYAVTHA